MPNFYRKVYKPPIPYHCSTWNRKLKNGLARLAEKRFLLYMKNNLNKIKNLTYQLMERKMSSGERMKKIIIDSNPKRQEMFEQFDKLKHIRSNFKKEKNYTINPLKINTEEIRKVSKKILREQLNELLEQGGFLDGIKKYLVRYIDQEISCRLSEANIQELVKTKVYELTIKNLNELIMISMEHLTKKQNQILQDSLKRTKELVYSIDSTTKECLRGLPISANGEEIILNMIQNNIFQKKKRITYGGEDEL